MILDAVPPNKQQISALVFDAPAHFYSVEAFARLAQRQALAHRGFELGFVSYADRQHGGFDDHGVSISKISPCPVEVQARLSCRIRYRAKQRVDGRWKVRRSRAKPLRSNHEVPPMRQ